LVEGIQRRDASHRARDPHGLAFGKLCYESPMDAEVVQGGTTLRETLAELNIPRRTAYFWMERYEESIRNAPELRR
jgi:hypothetical protein